MRLVLWIIALFALAVAAALGLGHNNGMVTVFWPPYRADVSLTLAVLLALAAAVLIHFAWIGVQGLTRLPQRSRRWRFERRLQASQQWAMQALFHALGGRFVRADALAQRSLDALNDLMDAPDLSPSEVQWLAQLRWLNSWTQGECKQSLRDLPGRNRVIEAWQRMNDMHPPMQRNEIQDAETLIQARWALDAREARIALNLLEQLSRGASHRALTLRLKLKAFRALGMHDQALRTARALAKHGGFSTEASQRMMQSLALASLRHGQEPSDLLETWKQLDSREQRLPLVGLQAAERGLHIKASSEWVMDRLHAVWLHWMDHFDELDDELQERLLLAVLEAMPQANANGTPVSGQVNWLERAEQAHLRHPRHAGLLAFYGLMCQKQALWGKAQSTLDDATRRLTSPKLKRLAHVALATLAESRNDANTALKHWRSAAQS